jgi:hypothetical protein
MKRTLLAVGVAVLISMMLIPRGDYGGPVRMWLPWFYDTQWLPWNTEDWEILWTEFFLQTVFAAVLFAVLVNLFAAQTKKVNKD